MNIKIVMSSDDVARIVKLAVCNHHELKVDETEMVISDGTENFPEVTFTYSYKVP